METVFLLCYQEEIDMREFNNERGNRPFHKSGFRRDFGPREMHKATCSECGKDCEVPFRPVEGKPVYCKECYMRMKESNQ